MQQNEVVRAAWIRFFSETLLRSALISEKEHRAIQQGLQKATERTSKNKKR